MVSNRFLGSIGNAIDSAASGTFLAKRASGPVFETLDYSDISNYPTGADVDSAAIVNLIDSNFLSTRAPGLDITTTITDSGLNHIVPDSAGEAVKIGNYSKGIANVFADSSTTITIPRTEKSISTHTISLNNNQILLDGGTAASNFDLASTQPFGTQIGSVISLNRKATFLRFNGDGTRVYYYGSTSGYYANLNPPYDVRTGNDGTDWNDDGTFTIPDKEYVFVYDYQFSGDGTKLIICDDLAGGSNGNGKRILQYTLSTAYDMTTLQSSPYSYEVSTDMGNAGISTQYLNLSHLSWNANGSKLILFNNANDNFYEVGVSSNYDISSTKTWNSSKVWDLDDFNLTGSSQRNNAISTMQFNDDGTNLYIADAKTQYPEDTYLIDLTSGFDMSTASYNGKKIDAVTKGHDYASGGDGRHYGIYEWTSEKLLFVCPHNKIATVSLGDE